MDCGIMQTKLQHSAEANLTGYTVSTRDLNIQEN